MSSFEMVQKKYDVVVVGGGLSGLCAAIASARHGALTALIQNRSVLGGNASSEVRMHICGASCHSGKQNLNESGILLELLLENKKRNGYAAFPVFDTVLWEKARFQEGLDLYLNTTLEEAEVEGQRIRAVTCRQNTTETAFRFEGDIFIDATGHATLGVLSGAETRVGSEGRTEFGEPNAPAEPNTTVMGSTLMFEAVDRGEPVPFEKPSWAYTFTEEDLRYRPHVNMNFSMGEGGEQIEFTEDGSKALPNFSTMDAGYWWIELGGQYADIVKDAEEIRDDLLRCVFGVWDHIKNGGDHGAQNYDLSWVGMVPGYRESRRLVGDYLLNENDVRANRVFEDAVAYGGWPMDEHVRGGILAFDELPGRTFNFEGAYTIPYRSYYSKNIDNLMMAGRDISVTKMAYGTVRVMGTCAVGGQAVGTAAAMASKRGMTPRELGQKEIKTLQQGLLRDDCYIPGCRNEDPADLARQAAASATSQLPGREAENVLNGVARSEGAQQNCWESAALADGPQAVTLRFDQPVAPKSLQIAFDPNLSKEIMPSLTSSVRARQVKGLPPELVKDYAVHLFEKGQEVFYQKVSGNGQRLNILELPGVSVDEVRIEVSATHGWPNARVFEVRLY